jgi:4-deoxy-L-threo-5-hexosulose-uronate ketol-isomerase
METRHAVHPEHAARMDTDELRRHFLIEDLFTGDAPKLVYSFYDRLIVGGSRPIGPTVLTVDTKAIGASFLLERREMGVINIGGPGSVTVDGEAYALAPRDGLFIGKGKRGIVFDSLDAADPARFYFLSAPAHSEMPTRQISFAEAEPNRLGSAENSNQRTIRKYFHPDGIQSCQLVMGMTTLEPGSVWNTMPPHSHDRRMEAYLYFDIPGDNVVFHLMGEHDRTRHIVVREGQAVLSPSWSIHSGVGTGAYTFIWGMAGENQTFSDMDHIAMADIR